MGIGFGQFKEGAYGVHDSDYPGQKELKVGDDCPFCKKAKVVLVEEYFPWTTDHLQCPKCDSTYNLK
jgi:hypothetical protein